MDKVTPRREKEYHYLSAILGLRLGTAELADDLPAVNATDDVAELLPDGRFRILGRKDNIINSGGIKIQTEIVEEILRPIIPTNFAITSVPDPKFGEAMILLITTGNDRFPSKKTASSLIGKQSLSLPENYLFSELKEMIFGILPKYQRPKHILRIESIPLTGSGKIDRAACRKLAMERYTG